MLRKPVSPSRWYFYCLAICFVPVTMALAQVDEGAKPDEEEAMKHFLSASVGYTFIPKADGLEATEAGGFFVPSIGIDYFYKLYPRWEIGIMADVELDHYLIVDKDLERENALVTALVGAYKPSPNWNLTGGLGMEFENHENLFVLRLGVERPFELGNEWILGPSFFFDFKEGYDAWSIAIAVGKEF